MGMFKVGDHVSIEVETMAPPYRYHGVFVEESEDWVKVQATVGDDLGKKIVVPKPRIKAVHVS